MLRYVSKRGFISGTAKGLAAALIAASAFSAQPALAAKKESFRVAWSIYVGWMPWDYAAEKGIVDKWAKKYGIEIEVVQINDYIESINQFSAGAFDGCVMTTARSIESGTPMDHSGGTT